MQRDREDSDQHLITHFVGFRGDEYWSAVAIWGRPTFIHRRWDRRAQRDIGPGEIVIFATGDETKPLARFNGDDYDESVFGDVPR